MKAPMQLMKMPASRMSAHAPALKKLGLGCLEFAWQARDLATIGGPHRERKIDAHRGRVRVLYGDLYGVAMKQISRISVRIPSVSKPTIYEEPWNYHQPSTRFCEKKIPILSARCVKRKSIQKCISLHPCNSALNALGFSVRMTTGDLHLTMLELESLRGDDHARGNDLVLLDI